MTVSYNRTGGVISPGLLNSSVSSIQDLFDKSPFVVKTEDDFKNIPIDNWNLYIKEVTVFDSWNGMLKKATEEYVAKKLGF